jgi:transcriptional regulator with PAS, ATPase and Fis domain
MRVTVEKDNGETEVFQNITDLYIAYRQEVKVTSMAERLLNVIAQTRSHSWGGNVRELVKELQQSLVELQEFLRGHQHGGSS